MAKAKLKQYYFVEHTDTYGGEANYCWCNRFKVYATSPKHALTQVKQYVYNNPSKVRHHMNDYGDTLEVRFRGICHIMFIDEWEEQTHNQYMRIKEL